MASVAKKYKRLVVWMRRDLRVADNAALSSAYDAAEQVIPLFILDAVILNRPDTGSARVIFLLDALKVLDKNLQKLGARLIIRSGSTPDTLLQAVTEFQADGVFFHREYEPFGRQRDAKVIEELQSLGIAYETFKDLVLVEPDEILTKAKTPYTVYTPYKNVWMGLPFEPPYPTPKHIAVPKDVHGLTIDEATEAISVTSSQSFECGGEDDAKALLADFTGTKLANYATARDVLGVNGTSLLSRHLHLGTISPRTIVAAIQHTGAVVTKNESGAHTFIGELAWREFYLQILYHFPYVAGGAFRKQYDGLKWENDEELLNAWKDGRTGYPIVDAAMRQLKATAWMHNRGRMICASFLTKDLLIDWRIGERYFMQQLVDGDQAANNGGWQWSAGTGTDAQPYFRIFNPLSQGEKFDPEGDYVKRWVPELSKVPKGFIHRPWTLSENEREYWGCGQYPLPVVNHQQQRQQALSLYAGVAQGKES